MSDESESVRASLRTLATAGKLPCVNVRKLWRFDVSLLSAWVAFGATSSLKTLGTGLNHAFSNISSTLASSLT